MVVTAAAVALISASAAALITDRGKAPAAPTALVQSTDAGGGGAATDAPSSDDLGGLFSPDALARFAASPVPVLAPRRLTPEQASQLERTFQETPDGYFATLSADDYDVIFNATRSAASPLGARTVDPERARYSETEVGVAAMFAFEGAEYQVELACRGPGDPAGAGCVTEDDARAYIADLVAIPDAAGQ